LRVKSSIFRSITGEAFTILTAGDAVVGAVLADGTRRPGHRQLLPAVLQTGAVAAQVVAEGARGADGRGSAGCALCGAAKALARRLVVARHTNATRGRVESSKLSRMAGEAGEVV
jgi:ribosomal protein S14